MKKRYLLIIIFLLLILGINVTNAEEVHYFEKEHFDTPDEFNMFATQVCQYEGASDCKAYCTYDEESKYPETLSIHGIPCGGYDNIVKFKIGNGSIEQTIEALQRAKYVNNENCWEYLLKDSSYCKEYTNLDEDDPRYQLCNKVNDTEETTGRCSYIFKFDDKSKSIAITGELTTDQKDLIITMDDPIYTEYRGTFDGEILNISSTKLHFYPKNRNYNDFRTEYINQYIQEQKCPELCFIYDKHDTWYTSLDKEENNAEKYALGTMQCSSNGITTLDEKKDVSYISNNKITFENCEKLFEDSPQLLDMIKFIVNIVKIGIPILLIGLGILDFSRAIFSSKEDEMKKAQEKFIKRIIIGVSIFLVPIILKMILTIGNSVWGNISVDFCGIL